MQWTYSYPLPLNSTHSDPSDAEVSTIPVESNLWIFTQTFYTDLKDYKIDVFVFNIESSIVRAVNLNTPATFGQYLESVGNVGDQIYIWNLSDDIDGRMLFQLNTKTGNVTHIATIQSTDSRFFAIIGDLMFVLDFDTEDMMTYLYTIDLSTKEVSKKFLKLSDGVEHQNIFSKDDELFMVEVYSNYDRMVHKIVNGQLELILKDKITCGLHDECDCEIDTLGSKEGVWFFEINHEIQPIIYEDKFDVKQKNWSREVCSAPWTLSSSAYIECSTEVNGVTYAVLNRSFTDLVEYDIRVFEKVPKLSSTCLLSIVGKIMEDKDSKTRHELYDQLPAELGLQFGDMIGLRLIEESRRNQSNKERDERIKWVMDLILGGAPFGAVGDADSEDEEDDDEDSEDDCEDNNACRRDNEVNIYDVEYLLWLFSFDEYV